MRARLCHVYNLAINDSFNAASSKMLTSHLQETISTADIPTQTLHNRTIVQLGLSAFRAGLFKDAHSVLHDISLTGKTKELLAQGVSMQKFAERTPEEEKLDKSRQLPFHMHINLDVVDFVYLVSAMLLEIPNMALNAHDSRRKMFSKTFRRMFEYSERQVFTGPPENVRDHIMAASKAMTTGDWSAAIDYIFSVKPWDQMANNSAEVVKEKLAM